MVEKYNIEMESFLEYKENNTSNELELFESIKETDFELDEETERKIDEAVDLFMEQFENGMTIDDINMEMTNEGLLGSALGGLTGFALGKSIGKIVAKVLGIEKGVMYDMLTSRLVGAALGAAIFGGATRTVKSKN